MHYCFLKSERLMDGFVHGSRRMCPGCWWGPGEYLGKCAYIFHAMPLGWIDIDGRNMHACMGPPTVHISWSYTHAYYCDASQLFNVPACGTVCEVYMHAAAYVRTLRKLPNSSRRIVCTSWRIS